jgi:hypothetical protein
MVDPCYDGISCLLTVSVYVLVVILDVLLQDSVIGGNSGKSDL